MGYSPKTLKTLLPDRIQVTHMHRPAPRQQIRRHASAHVADPDDADRRFICVLCHDCINRFDLATDMRMPIPMPSVTMAVPP